MNQIDLLISERKHHLRLWVGVTIVLLLGIAFSVLLQVFHAPEQGGWVAMVVGGWPPFAAFLCVEIVTRIPIRGWVAGVARVGTTVAVAGFAMWVSYEQQYDYIHELGFEGRTVVFFPLTIDGVMLVATISLVEVSRKVRDIKREIQTLRIASVTPVVPPAEPVQQPAPAPTEPARAPEPAVVTPPQRPNATTGNGKRGRRPGPQTPPPSRRMPPRTNVNGTRQNPPAPRGELEVTVTEKPLVEAEPAGEAGNESAVTTS